MLETLVSLANFTKTAIYYALYGSCKMGNLLVTSISALLYHLSKFTESLVTFFSVLGQSFSIFFQDNLQFLQDLLAFAGTGFDSIYTTVYFTISKISKLVSATVNLVLSSYVGLSDLLTTTWSAWVQLVVFLKKMLILFGSGVWFLITLVPLLLFYTCKLFVISIQAIFDETIDICSSVVTYVVVLVKNIIFFAIDVPVEALAGLVIAISFGLIIKQMHALIAIYIKNKIRAMRNWYSRRHGNVRTNNPNEPGTTRAFRSTTRQRANNNKQSCATDNSGLETETCIICKDNIKCILLLPCRHVCLCEDCLRELRYYNKICPICRTGFTKTMKIYI